MVTLHEVLNQAETEGVAIGHFNVSDWITLKAVFESATDENVPVIVGASEGERQFLGVRQIAAVVKSLREECGFPIFLNADHYGSADRLAARTRPRPLGTAKRNCPVQDPSAGHRLSKGTSRGQIGIIQQRAASCAACVRAVFRKIGRRATAISQRVFSGKRVIEITRMRITEAGRRVLAESPGPVNENPHAFQPRATVANISGAAP